MTTDRDESSQKIKRSLILCFKKLKLGGDQMVKHTVFFMKTVLSEVLETYGNLFLTSENVKT